MSNSHIIVTKEQWIEGFVILFSFPIYAIIFRNITYFKHKYLSYMVMYGFPSFLTWITRKVVMNYYKHTTIS